MEVERVLRCMLEKAYIALKRPLEKIRMLKGDSGEVSDGFEERVFRNWKKVDQIWCQLSESQEVTRNTGNFPQ